MSKSKTGRQAKSKKNQDPETELWFVLDCKKDDSVCLISEPHVLFGQVLKKGDMVHFFMSRGSEDLVGIVDSFSSK